jgi:hypothetical protein
MATRWLIAGGLLYRECFKEVAVMMVCADVYMSGYTNVFDDMSKNTKKPFLRNIANMAEGTCTGLAKAVVFPVYIPSQMIYAIYLNCK